MNFVTRAMLAIGFLLGSASSAHSTHHASTHHLAWMEGCWASKSSETTEVWAVANDDLLFGYNVVRRNGATAFFEQLRIERTKDSWSYFAYPRGVGPVEFKMRSTDDAALEFANENHDYPQRIRYRRTSTGITADIALANGTKQKSWDFVACP